MFCETDGEVIIEKECEILGIADFEKESRSLCMKVFGSIDLPVLCESECEMLEYYMFSTTYGTQKQLLGFCPMPVFLCKISKRIDGLQKI